MVMSIFKTLLDFIYGTKRISENFSLEYPDDQILATDASKGTLTKGNQDVKRGLHWAISQRAVIILTDKRIKSGKWNIPLDNIQKAQLVNVKTIFGAGQILKLETKDMENFQFGMPSNAEWTRQKALPLTVELGKIKDTILSFIVRLILIAVVAYWILVMIG